MKMFKKVLPVLLCVAIVMAVALTTFAAGGQSNVSMQVSADSVAIGDTVTVTVSYSDMKVSSFSCTVVFDKDLFECVSVVGPYASYGQEYERYFFVTKAGVPAMMATQTTEIVSTADEANANGQVGFGVINTNEISYAGQEIFTVTFRAKASGDAVFTLKEDTAGTDEFKGVSDTKIVTIEEACDHVDTTKDFVSNGNSTHKVICECGETVNESENCSGGTNSCTALAVCQYCDAAYGKLADHVFTTKVSNTLASAADCTNPAKYYVQCDNCTAVSDTLTVEVGEFLGHGHTNGFRYDSTGNDAHNVICDDCDQITEENVAHTYDAEDHKCICGKECPHSGDSYGMDNNDGTHALYCTVCDAFLKNEEHSYVDHICYACSAKFTGWYGDYYYVDAVVQKTGWTEIDGAWYYLDPETGVRAELLTRVPYHTALGYGPDQEALEYCANNGTEFIDATEAWFYFDENGKFVSDANGFVSHGGSTGKLVNGMLAWHPGLVEVAEGVYVYFIGDVVNGGNVMATGDVYMIRNTTDRDVVIGGVYTFGADGKLVENNGVVKMADGTLRYYDNAQWLIGAGLVEYNNGYVYVRSDGALATGIYYAGEYKYEFDENGYMASIKEGIVDGFYYEKGHLKYSAGLIEYGDGYIYVRSNGKVVMGTGYWITNVNNTGIAMGYYEFDANGMIIIPETYGYNGIVDGYYYENGHIVYGAGLIEYNGDIYYVRSNGQVATGTYYVININDMEGFSVGQKLVFGEDGKLITD